MTTWNVLIGDAIEQLRTLPDQSVQTCVTSPPYWGLRSYLPEGDPAKAHELGAEPTPDEYVANMVAVSREVWRVLRDDGTLWLNLGDSYQSSNAPQVSQSKDVGTSREAVATRPPRCDSLKPKDLVGIPWRVAFALQADGWYLRCDIIWHKPNPMPESVTDRPTKAHEYIFLLSKSARYYYDAEAIKESAIRGGDIQTFGGNKARTNQENGGDPRNGHRTDNSSQWGKTIEVSSTRNKRSVWTVSTKPYTGSHYAVFPPDLIEPCILAGTSAKGQCPDCGAPWERVVERTPMEVVPGPSRDERSENGRLRTQVNRTMVSPPTSQTIGWRPTCDCHKRLHNSPPSAPIPQTVLDPFVGSGTTLQVAIKHNRNAIGIDLDARNAELINERMSAIQPVLIAV